MESAKRHQLMRRTEKLAKRGVPYEIVDRPDSLERYSHLFFDGDKYAAVRDMPCPRTNLIALVSGPADESGLPPSLRTMDTPLTSLAVAQFLDKKIHASTTESILDSAASTLRLLNPRLLVVDATKLIRALPGKKYADLPIVALTANVVGDVRGMFLQSGMNDLLAKPIEVKELELRLKAWLPREKWRQDGESAAGL
jgi:CheY-like chemotaxis protein